MHHIGTDPAVRAFHHLLDLRHSSIGLDRFARSPGGLPAARSFTYRRTVWWSQLTTSAAAR